MRDFVIANAHTPFVCSKPSPAYKVSFLRPTLWNFDNIVTIIEKNSFKINVNSLKMKMSTSLLNYFDIVLFLFQKDTEN